MTPERRAAETQVLLMHMNDYWYEVDIKGGAGVSERFVADGIFDGGGEPLVGREAIEQFYGWRRSRGARVSRHVITNFRADFHDDRSATTHCVMLLFAADGEPILPSTPPIMITDLIDTCIKDEGGEWRYVRRTFVPLFQGEIAPTIPPPSIAENFNTPVQA
ncbi:MAG: nuclear transport factor 2 family protein [Sphingomonas sp.]